MDEGPGCDAPATIFLGLRPPAGIRKLWASRPLGDGIIKMSAPCLGPSHDDLLEAARAGSAEAFWQLAQGYRPYLRSVAARVLGGQLPGDGSDVVGNGLGLAFERLSQFHGPDAVVFLGWLAAIVRNEALRLLRREGRLRPLPEGSRDGERLAGDSSGPEAKASRREQAARLLAAIERLPEDYRVVLELRNFQELPFEEVAGRMGRSSEAVRQLWSRAVRRLRGELGEDR
jgi:RNA polymerase sigma-70 factor (ECF subfamily)